MNYIDVEETAAKIVKTFYKHAKSYHRKCVILVALKEAQLAP